jgi:hypothetical protein
VVASQYVHPEFGFFCPSPRFRRRLRLTLACLLVAGVGATMMAPADRPGSDAAVTRVDAASIVETLPATSLTPFAPLSSNRTVVEGTHSASDKPRCVGDALADLDGNCVSIKLRKPRMVRAATDRPAIAAVALGRTATSNIDAALPAASAGREGDPEKSSQGASAPVAVAGSTEPSPPEGGCYAQEGTEVGAPSKPTPRQELVWRSVLARGAGRRLGCARLRAEGEQLPAGRIRPGLRAKFLVIGWHRHDHAGLRAERRCHSIIVDERFRSAKNSAVAYAIRVPGGRTPPPGGYCTRGPRNRGIERRCRLAQNLQASPRRATNLRAIPPAACLLAGTQEPVAGRRKDACAAETASRK